jgi:hypothetical protein
LKGRKLNELSNDELKKLTARLQLERQYKDLTRIDQTPGRKFVSEVLQNTGKQLASKFLADAITKGASSLFDVLKRS